jgi:signal transduction histidine kinase
VELGVHQSTEPYLLVERRRSDPQRDRIRLAVLAEIGLLFASRDDHLAILERVVDVAVPALADRCAVFLRGRRECLDRVAVKYADPTQPAFSSQLAVPMVVRARVIGVLVLSRVARPGYDRDDLAFVEELARRVAMYVDHAMLLRDQKHLIAELERTNRDLDQFAYVASHDLKTPLRGIGHLATAIEEDLATRMTERTQAHLELLRSRVHRLEDMIDGVLRYSRAGRISEPAVSVEVGALVREVVELLDPPPEIRIAISPALPAVHTSRIALQQVFLNLIGNALKHAHRADLEIVIGGVATDDGWELFVRDNGPGIAPEHHDRIWGMFCTLSARDQVEGSGIGLALVRRTVESVGGRTWIESDAGTGATFYFTWPTSTPQRWRRATSG